MKRILSIIITVCLLLSCAACNKQQISSNQVETRSFTDDLGRTITLPKEISKYAVSGIVAQYYLIPLAPEGLVGLSREIPKEMQAYYPDYISNLEVLGQIYGGKGTIDSEKIISLNPDVIIDMGEQKNNIVTDLENLSQTLGIPIVHIDVTALSSAEAYRKLGELFNNTKAYEMADFLENALTSVNYSMKKVHSANAVMNMLYSVSDTGLNVYANGSFQATALDLVVNNVAVIDNIVSSGAGNEVSLEQIYAWNPDTILFLSQTMYSSVKDNANWNGLNAIKEEHYYLVPQLPTAWLASPPNYLHILGAAWLASTLYPDYIDYDMTKVTQDFFSLFYNRSLNEQDCIDLLNY